MDSLARLDAETKFTDQRGIHIDLSFVYKLGVAILVLVLTIA